jgi:hypothetical protein
MGVSPTESNPLVDWILRLIKMHALKGLKRALHENEDRIVKGSIIAGFEVSKSVLTRETQQMVASGVATTVISGLFLEFLFGVGPQTREFGSRSVMAVRMQDAYGVKEAKSYFYKERAKLYKKSPGLLVHNPLTNYSAGFNPIMGPIRAWDDAVEQFIGNYKVEIFLDQRATQMEIVCTNVTSIHSFLYHIPFVKNYERGNGSIPTFMGNITQIISWDEPIDVTRFEEYL